MRELARWAGYGARVLGLSAAVSICALAVAPAQAKSRALIVQWGEVDGVQGAPLGPEYKERSLGQGYTLEGLRFINHADEIPAQLCRRFGFDAWFTREPGEPAPEQVTILVRHPLLTRPDGATSAEDSLTVPVRHGHAGSAFTFDNPWEAQPGTWTFEIVSEGEVIGSKSFTVVPPAPGSPASVCVGAPVA
jgi:hypothetical protein